MVWVAASFVTMPVFHAGVWEEVGEIAIACVIPELCLVCFRGWLQLTMQVTSLWSDGEPTAVFCIIGGVREAAASWSGVPALLHNRLKFVLWWHTGLLSSW